RVYVAPCDRQLIISEKRRFGVVDRVDGTGHRTADGLMISVGRVLGERGIGVVLSGLLDGGAQGVREIKHNGGRVLVEDPGTAVAPAMPRAALATGCVDYALSPEILGNTLVALCAATGAAELFKVRLNASVAG